MFCNVDSNNEVFSFIRSIQSRSVALLHGAHYCTPGTLVDFCCLYWYTLLNVAVLVRRTASVFAFAPITSFLLTIQISTIVTDCCLCWFLVVSKLLYISFDNF